MTENNTHIPHPFELFGVECHKGWFDLLKPIFDYVEKYNNDKDETKQIRFLQIKEKWGSLNIYTNFVTKKLKRLIQKAEEQSDYVCEECGSRTDVGKRLNGWITTMCLECAKKEAETMNYPQLWEANSDLKRYWIMPDGKIEEIEETDSEEDEHFKYGF